MFFLRYSGRVGMALGPGGCDIKNINLKYPKTNIKPYKTNNPLP